jgi:hypothetical protein
MPRHANTGRGWCRWCGLEVLDKGERSNRRAWHSGRDGEPDCAREHKLFTDRWAQVNFVIKRDGPGCNSCGVMVEKWRHEELAVHNAPWRDPRTGIEYWRYTAVERVLAMELDHRMPLWLVAHLPDDERRWWFGPANLQLLCPPCHSIKTAAEATRRGKANRQAEMDQPRPCGRIPSRRFPKGPSRPIPSRPFLSR